MISLNAKLITKLRNLVPNGGFLKEFKLTRVKIVKKNRLNSSHIHYASGCAKLK